MLKTRFHLQNPWNLIEYAIMVITLFLAVTMATYTRVASRASPLSEGALQIRVQNGSMVYTEIQIDALTNTTTDGAVTIEPGLMTPEFHVVWGLLNAVYAATYLMAVKFNPGAKRTAPAPPNSPIISSQVSVYA